MAWDSGVSGGCFFRPLELENERKRWLAIVASRLVQACDLVILAHGSHVPATRGKVRVPGGRTFKQKLCEKKPLAYLPVVNHNLWCSQLCEIVHRMPVQIGRSPRVMVVAQEVDWLAVLPGDGTKASSAPEFILAMFSQPRVQFLWAVLLAWHDGVCGKDSQFVLQQVVSLLSGEPVGPTSFL